METTTTTTNIAAPIPACGERIVYLLGTRERSRYTMRVRRERIVHTAKKLSLGNRVRCYIFT